ncbi:HAD family phosphatase [Plantactinospora veratri]|uniref:HAD family phosphatase n=1 Tax=Plantactinospora veratri TaxID=1436122 RepID=A0ABU7SLA5_9ACTN
MTGNRPVAGQPQLVGPQQHPARPSAVAFDLDGTLVDLERFHHDALLRAAREVGVALRWDEALRRLPHFVGGPDARLAAEVAALAGTGVSPAEVLTAKRRCFASLVGAVDEIVPRTGAAEILHRLADRGVPMAVGTVTERGTALGILRRAGLLPLFGADRVVTARDVAELKPAPHVYRETARRLGVPPAGQLVFEDSVTGITAARSAGSPVVAMPTVPDRGYLASVGAAGATAVFPDWRHPELPRLLDRLLGPGVPEPSHGGRARHG